MFKYPLRRMMNFCVEASSNLMQWALLFRREFWANFVVTFRLVLLRQWKKDGYWPFPCPPTPPPPLPTLFSLMLLLVSCSILLVVKIMKAIGKLTQRNTASNKLKTSNELPFGVNEVLPVVPAFSIWCSASYSLFFSISSDLRLAMDHVALRRNFGYMDLVNLTHL